MKNLTKQEVDRIVSDLLSQEDSLNTRQELECHLGGLYTKTQLERIWYRFRYVKSAGGERIGREDSR